MEKDENKSIELKNDKPQAFLGALRYFSSDTNFVFILKKTERLASALYLITGFFDNEEPLKWKLRKLSGRLLSSSLELKDTRSKNKEISIIDLEGTVLEIGSLLLIAKNSGLISEMNYEIISKEFNVFADTLANQSDLLSREGNAGFGNSYFEVNLPQIKPKQTQAIEQMKAPEIKDNSRDMSIAYVPTLDVLDRMAGPQGENQTAEKGQKVNESVLANGLKNKVSKEPKALKEFGAVAVKKNSRQSIIISLLRRKKEIMIKDVSPLIHGCSEKTIQRELLSMVDKGILKKIGEKRWSRYSLA